MEGGSKLKYGLVIVEWRWGQEEGSDGEVPGGEERRGQAQKTERLAKRTKKRDGRERGQRKAAVATDWAYGGL